MNKNSELLKRVLSAAVLIPVVLFVVLAQNTVPFAVLIYFATLLAGYEYIQIAQKSIRISKPLVWAGIITVPLVFHLKNLTLALLLALLILFIFIAFLIKMFSEEPERDTLKDVSANVFSALFIPLLMSFFWLIRVTEWGGDGDSGGRWIVLLCMGIWASDVMAYFVGRAFGRHHIVPKISPKKSLEGFVAGFFFGILFTMLFYHIFIPQVLKTWQLMILAADIVAAGILGDLFESMLKRNAGVKDSGRLIPGHGGLLDRIDSLLFAAPVLYIYLKLFTHIN